jgi:hypothetical protein
MQVINAHECIDQTAPPWGRRIDYHSIFSALWDVILQEMEDELS